MKDQEFDEIMGRYVSGTSKGMDADLKKYYEKEKEKPKKRVLNKFVWVPLSIVIVIALTLSIVLPLTLRPNGNSKNVPLVEIPPEGGTLTEDPPKTEEKPPVEKPSTRYYANEDLETTQVELSALSTEYGIDALLPNIEYQEILVEVLLSKEEEKHLLGGRLNLTVYDVYFDTVQIYTLFKNNTIEALEHYETMANEVVWQEKTVKYNVEYDEITCAYNGKFCFTADGLDYYIDAVYYEDMVAGDVLDLIF